MTSAVQRRHAFIDALRGWAFVFMVVNHTTLSFLDGGLARYQKEIFLVTVALAAPLFLFLVGFSLALSGARRTRQAGYLRHYTARGLYLIALGFAVNLATRQDGAVISGGILQTIGLSLICLAPLLRATHRSDVRVGLVIGALTLYLAFIFGYPPLARLLEEAPWLKRLFFDGFPPWPWVGAAMVGLAAGSSWLDHPSAQPHLARTLGEIGLLCLLLYTVSGFLIDDVSYAALGMDYIVNGHWLPGPLTILLVAGGVSLSFFLVHYLVESRRQRLQWLQWLGRSALLLYVVHLLLIRVVGVRVLKLDPQSWWQFAMLNVALFAIVLALAYTIERWRHRHLDPVPDEHPRPSAVAGRGLPRLGGIRRARIRARL